VAPVTTRLTKCEQLLQGKTIDDNLLGEVEKTAPQEITPIDDVRSTAEYRQQVAGVLAKRVVQEALQAV
jgi:carbon-monoxide dehydrogenase medium subunit